MTISSEHGDVRGVRGMGVPFGSGTTVSKSRGDVYRGGMRPSMSYATARMGVHEII